MVCVVLYHTYITYYTYDNALYQPCIRYIIIWYVHNIMVYIVWYGTIPYHCTIPLYGSLKNMVHTKYDFLWYDTIRYDIRTIFML